MVVSILCVCVCACISEKEMRLFRVSHVGDLSTGESPGETPVE